MPGASLALFADLGACHVQKSSVTICVLPAPSGWRATALVNHTRISPNNFYPRPPGGGRLGGKFVPCRIAYFYPRPPGGGRRVQALENGQVLQFLSTPSGWRATDSSGCATRWTWNFYPRPPGGGRPPQSRCTCRGHQGFLSTPSGWRATYGGAQIVAADRISIHALRVEGD